ncbi:hypothetical protein BDV18DRAFT_160113 [Aspergillus unguis]
MILSKLLTLAALIGVSYSQVSTSVTPGFRLSEPYTTTSATQKSTPPASTISSSGSSSLGGDLSTLLDGLSGLAAPNLLSDLEDVVHDAAYLLRAPTANNTKSLLGTASELLNPSTANQLLDAARTLQRIITPEAVSELEKLDLGEVFKDIRQIYTTAKSLLNGDSGLLSMKNIETIFNKLNILFTTIGPAITRQNMNRLGGLMDVAINLLTPKFANETTGIVDAASGLLNSQLLDEAGDILRSIETVDPEIWNDLGTILKSTADV